jgi:hypothetical protein
LTSAKHGFSVERNLIPGFPPLNSTSEDHFSRLVSLLCGKFACLGRELESSFEPDMMNGMLKSQEANQQSVFETTA